MPMISCFALILAIAAPTLSRASDVGEATMFRGDAVGEKWGLRGSSIGISAIDPKDASAVLAVDEFGLASSWVKGYGGREGTGLLQLTIPRNTPTDLAPFLAAVERGL
jgi:hypothetical protein